MGEKKIQRYSEEFRRQAVALADEPDKTKMLELIKTKVPF